jgi:hypothetical protein
MYTRLNRTAPPSQGYAAYDPNVMKPHIYLHPVGDDARPRPK